MALRPRGVFALNFIFVWEIIMLKGGCVFHVTYEGKSVICEDIIFFLFFQFFVGD